MKIPKIVMILWNDAWANATNFYEAEELNGATGMPLYSVGFVITDTKEGVILGIQYDPEHPGRFRHIQFVPRKAIKKVFVLREACDK